MCVVTGGVYFEFDELVFPVLPRKSRDAIVMVLLPREPELPSPAMRYRPADRVPKRQHECHFEV
eukprot:5462096-Prymnesium_polylepis.3